MTGFRAWRRRLRFGLPTVLGLGERAFLIPYRYAGSLPPAGTRRPYGRVEALFDRSRATFEACLEAVEDFGEPLMAIGNEPPPAPRWGQDWFPRLDAAVAYTMARLLSPRRIVEIGSGHSTRFFARAVADGGLETTITAIDPAPRAVLDGLPALAIERRTVGPDDLDMFRALAADDILAIDSSHILMPGSDVDLLLNHALPALAPGVVVHIHDVFLPDDYPVSWAWRGYNEQLGVAAMLAGGGWQPLFASRYATTRMASALRGGVLDRLPLPEGAIESSLWLKKG